MRYAKVPRMVMPVVEVEAEEVAIDEYANIYTAKLQGTICRECYGCGMLEMATFSGKKDCINYMKAQRGRHAK